MFPFDTHFWFQFLKLLHMAEVLIKTDKKQELFIEMFASSLCNELRFGTSSWMFTRQPNDHIDERGFEIVGFTSLLNVSFVSYKERRCARQVLQIFPNSPGRHSGASPALTPRLLWFYMETNCSSAQFNWSNPHPWSASTHTHTQNLSGPASLKMESFTL